jgi:hypothetical protein
MQARLLMGYMLVGLATGFAGCVVTTEKPADSSPPPAPPPPIPTPVPTETAAPAPSADPDAGPAPEWKQEGELKAPKNKHEIVPATDGGT